MEVTVLASGSSGNSLLVSRDGCSVLVDAGLSAKRTCELLAGLGIAPERLTAILLTHEHGDHSKGLKVLAKKCGVPVYATPLTAESLQRGGVEAEWRLFASGARFQVGVFDIHAFSVPHDAADPVGFVVRANGLGFGVLTDLGFATRQVIECVRGVDALLVETNHDEDLLQRDVKRPWSVKQRITSRHGHLSNRAAAALVAEIACERLRHVVLGHLSRDCNAAELALRAMQESLAGRCRAVLHCAPCDGVETLRVQL